MAAGNSDDDASNYSPARAEQAITVAASTFADEKYSISNYGATVNIWAAGRHVTSTWNDGKTKTKSGTSMAAPHVAGFAAYLLGIDSTLTPDQIATIISDRALDGVLSGVREFFAPRCMFDLRTLKSTPPVADGTVNKLLNNFLALRLSDSGKRGVPTPI